MSDSDGESNSGTGIKIPRFHGKRGEDYGLWRLRLRAACRVKGVWNVVESSSDSSTATDAASGETDTAPSRNIAKLEKASGIIISALGDAPLRVVLEADDDPKRMLKLLDARYASNRTVSRIAVQTQLFRMRYTDQNMSTYVDQYTSLFAQLERMGKDAAIPETHKAPMLLASIDPQCPLESTAAALRTKDVVELTWDYVATTLIDEYNARQMPSSSSGRGNRNRSWRKRKGKGGLASTTRADLRQGHSDSDDASDIESTARALAAALKSFKSERGGNSNGLHCDFCDRGGHTEDRCHLNPANPNNRLPPKVRERFAPHSKKTGASSTGNRKDKGKVEIVGATVEKTTLSPPHDLRSYADSGATVHCFHSEIAFVPGSLESCDERTIFLADKTCVKSNYCGDVLLPFQNANVRLKRALYIPNLGYNLVSTGRLADNGIESHFRRDDVQLVLQQDEFVIGHGYRDTETGMYMLPEPLTHHTAEVVTVSSANESTELWHRRLGHINSRDLSTLHKHVEGVPQLSELKEVCRACRLGKAHKLPFPGHFEHAAAVGDVVHSDIVGPLESSFPERYKYASTFLDDHSRYTFIGLMHKRSDLQETFDGVSRKFQRVGGARKKVHFSGPIAKVHSDGAREYIALQNSLGGGDENKSFSPPYTPELNAIAERVNRTMVEGALSMLIQADLPSCLWPFAIKHVIYVRNRVPHSTTGVTPFSVFTGKTPSLNHVRVFGCTAYVLRLPRGSKFEPRATEGVYLETMEHGIYKVLITDDEGFPKIVESRHVTFDETKFPGAPILAKHMEESDSDEEYETEGDSSHSGHSDEVSLDDFDAATEGEDTAVLPSDEPDSQLGDDRDDEDDNGFEDAQDTPSTGQIAEQEDAEPSRYPRRTRRQTPAWYIASSAQTSKQVTVTTSDEPTLTEALNATPEERELWKLAIDDEFQSLESKHTWFPDDAPTSQPLPTHVVLKVKRRPDGNIERFKARIVAGGNYQVYGENYKETYAPVVSFPLVRIFLYFVVCLKMFVTQLDVKTAFLNGELKEDVWVMSPRGIPGLKSRSYRLVKAIYGLKQAHLAWHTKLCGDLMNLGFEELPSAPCIFKRTTSRGQHAYILVYVDDILVTAHSGAQRDGIVEELKTLYDLRVADQVDMFLGVQLKWSEDLKRRIKSLTLSQPLYIEGVLRRFGLEESKPARTPMVEGFYSGLASEEDKSIVQLTQYQQMIGSLLYLGLRTRPDILVAVLILARFQKSPTAYCHRAAKRILRYLRGTTAFSMTYTTSGTDLHGFVDSDYAGDTVDRKSMSGYVVKLGDASVVWGCKKQDGVAISTCESEYYAMTLAAQEVVWIGRVLMEAGLRDESKILLRSDNQAAIEWATGERCPSGRAKHIDVRVHFVRQLVKDAKIDVAYVSSEKNDADVFTKPLGPVSLKEILKRLGLGGVNEEEC